MPLLIEPDVIPVGHSVRLVSTRKAAEAFGVRESTFLRLLESLEIPTETYAGSSKLYFNLFSLEFALFGRLLPKHIPPKDYLDLWKVASKTYHKFDTEATKEQLRKWDANRRQRKKIMPKKKRDRI